MTKIPDYEDPINIKSGETLHMLAKRWEDKLHKTYLLNFRNLWIKSLKTIKTGSIEGDALELAERRGRIAAIEDILLAERDAFENLTKLKKNLNGNKKISGKG